MNSGKTIFSQLMEFLPIHEFRKCIVRYNGNYKVKSFTCWDQFVAMVFCQLAQAHSLREICDGLACCLGKLTHLGVSNAPNKSTLAYANQHRPWELYQTVFGQLLEKCRAVAPRKKKFRFRNKLYSLDSSVIDLCLSLFDWAQFRQTKGAVKLHLLLDHDGYLPTFLLITDGKHHDVRVAQKLHLPAGSVVAMDRGYNDYRLFGRWTGFAGRRRIVRLHLLPRGTLLRHVQRLVDRVVRFLGHAKLPTLHPDVTLGPGQNSYRNCASNT